MSRDLNETLQRFAAAENSSVKYKGLTWDEFELFLIALKELEKICDQLVAPIAVTNWLKALRFARKILRSSPVNPGHHALQLETFLNIEVSSFPEQFALALQKCQQAVSLLLEVGFHPSWDHIDSLHETARQTGKEITINSLVVKAAVVLVEEIALVRNWKINPMNLSQSKRAPISDIALVFGSPEFHTGWEIDFDESSRIVAWLFNAPMAHETHVLSWPGNFRFDVGRYSPWKGATVKNVSTNGSTSFRVDIDRHSEISVSNTPPPILTDATTGLIEPVNATAFRLTDDYWIFLSDDVGPSANFVDIDDFDVVVTEAKTIRNLAPGTVLIVRDGEAGRSFLEDEAGKWIKEKHDTAQQNRSLEARKGFREAVQALGRDQFAISKLKAVGLDEDHARRRLRLAHDPDHIAPKDREVFEAVCQAADHEINEDDWGHIVILRTAYRQAGHRARKQLEEAIQADSTWQEAIEIPAQARISRKGLGAIVLAPIIQVLEEPVSVPISQLGTLKKVSRQNETV